MSVASGSFINDETVNTYAQGELFVHDAAIIYQKAILNGTPLHFECNDGRWVCVKGDES